MYILVNRVGDNFGVLDTNDGVIDWLSGEKIKHLTHRGIQIAGVNKNGFEPQSYKIASTLCNWDNGNNIFETGRCWVLSQKGVFKFIAGKKQYKGHVINIKDDIYTLCFSFGVITDVNINVLMKMANR